MGMGTVGNHVNHSKSTVVGTNVVVMPRGCNVRQYRGYGDSGNSSAMGMGAIN